MPTERSDAAYTPCTCTIACIPQGITDEQTCRLQLENDPEYLEEAGWAQNEAGEWNRFSYDDMWTTFEHALATQRRWDAENGR